MLDKRLKILRLECEKTQEEVAKDLGISRIRYNQYETGKRTPDNEILVQISEYFNVSVDYLLSKSDIRNPYENHERISKSIEDDPELLEFWEVLKEREDLQLMFKQTKQMSPKDIRQIIKIIKAIEDEEQAEN